MSRRLEEAKRILEENGASLVVIKRINEFEDTDDLDNDNNKIEYDFENYQCFYESGIKELVGLATKVPNDGCEGAICADKIVGRAAAFLYEYLKVKEVYAKVLSKSGKCVLEDAGIVCSYDCLTDEIINRMGTGPCPMDKIVSEVSDCRDAYNKLFRAIV